METVTTPKNLARQLGYNDEASFRNDSPASTRKIVHMTDLSASVRRLTDALMKEKLREAETEVLRKHSGSAQQAEHEPIIRQTARDACEWTVATIADSLRSDIDLRTALMEAFRGQDARVVPSRLI